MRMFQSTLPYRERRYDGCDQIRACRFQSTLPYRERLEVSFLIAILRVVSIHAPVQGATHPRERWTSPSWFQSTLPYRERRGSDPPGSDFAVSIHAPVQGATDWAEGGLFAQAVSIHAPVQGATVQANCKRGIGGVSIHAPVQGATCRRAENIGRPESFNPRSRTGSDYVVRFWLGLCSSFNPRSRTGSDSLRRSFECLGSRFQSTLPYRERPFYMVFFPPC